MPLNKVAPMSLLVGLMVPFVTHQAIGGPYIPDFTELVGGSGAIGEWQATCGSANPGISLAVWQTGGAIMGANSPSPSILDGTFPWRDPLPQISGVWSPQFDGDMVSVEVPGGGTCTMRVEFNAVVSNPVVSFNGLDVQTRMEVGESFTRIAATDNLLVIGNSVESSGVPVLVFGEEAAGSLQVNGAVSTLFVTLHNSGNDPLFDFDQIGFVFSTVEEPLPLPSRDGQLSLAVIGEELVLSWPDTATFSAIEASPDLRSGNWSAVAVADPAKTTSHAILMDSIGDLRYFRGVRAANPGGTQLSVEQVGPTLVLTWSRKGAFSALESSPGLDGEWSVVEEANPLQSTSHTIFLSSPGGARFFRGVIPE